MRNTDGDIARTNVLTAAMWTPRTVSVCLHSKGPQGAKAKGEVVKEILAAIKERRGV